MPQAERSGPLPLGGARLDLQAELGPCLGGVALEGRLGQAYNEETFRYFLAIERKRAERSGCPFLLLLVELKEREGAGGRIDSIIGDDIFSSLSLSLRDSDFVGWYRETLVVGAVLTELGDGHLTEVSRRIAQRVSEMLATRLPQNVASCLQVQISQAPPA